MPTQEEIIDALVLVLSAQRAACIEDFDAYKNAGRLLDARAGEILYARRRKLEEEKAKSDETVYGVALVTVPRKLRSDRGKSRGPLHKKARGK
jgi:hypothetical protein